MSAHVSFNLIVITDLEENVPETMATSEEKKDKKIRNTMNKKKVENALSITQCPSV